MKLFTWAILFLLAAAVLSAADLTGTWTIDVMLDAGSGTATFVFEQKGENLSGTYAGTFGKANVNGTVKGDRIEFSFDADQVGKVSYTGTMQGDKAAKGTVVYGQLGNGTFTAKKQ